MRKIFSFFVAQIIVSGALFAQVGVGTSTPDASAKLEVKSTNQGFLPPRVALTGTADVSTVASPATGLMVYNTATAGTSPANVTPGFYYYDGTKWQRIINQQPDATVDFNTANPNTGSPVFTGGPAASANYIYVSSVNNTQWTWNGTAYVTYTPTASTEWYLTGGTNDAGSNKTGSVYRSGAVGIGTPNAADTSAFLSVNASNKGFLPPRISLIGTSDVSTIGNPSTGLLIFNTATAGSGSSAVVPGYYYYSGTTWVKLGEEKATSVSGVSVIGGNATTRVTATYGNLKVSFLSGTISIGAVSGTFNVCGSCFYYHTGAYGTYIDCNSPKVLTTAWTNLDGAFTYAGDAIVWYLYDYAGGTSWRVSVIVGAGYVKNTIVIERLTQQ